MYAHIHMIYIYIYTQNSIYHVSLIEVVDIFWRSNTSMWSKPKSWRTSFRICIYFGMMIEVNCYEKARINAGRNHRFIEVTAKKTN